MNEKEAELIGMHVGDGTLYLSKKTLVWELRGSIYEKGFYEYVWNSGNAKGVCLAGFKNLDKWVKEVKPANSKHLKRIAEGLSNKNKVNLKSVSTNL